MVDREQTRRDAATKLARGWTAKPLPKAKIDAQGVFLVAEDYLALLAELEQAERERDEAREEVSILARSRERLERDLGGCQEAFEAQRLARVQAERKRKEARADRGRLALEAATADSDWKAAESRLAKVPALVEKAHVASRALWILAGSQDSPEGERHFAEIAAGLDEVLTVWEEE